MYLFNVLVALTVPNSLQCFDWQVGTTYALRTEQVRPSDVHKWNCVNACFKCNICNAHFYDHLIDDISCVLL